MLKEEIQRLSQQIHGDVIKVRRHLHANPELSFQEHNTSAFIKSHLDALEIPWRVVAGTGVEGIIKGDLASPEVIALRADMFVSKFHLIQAPSVPSITCVA